uniref:Centromere protein J n=1 Tax=Labrus bergylta TaxID=56723 RepID=A0A3Q3FGH4_9LABR
IMSSPAGLQHSQADFLARWMPSSTRAGVILNPRPDLSGSMRHISAVGSPPPPPLEPDDSFASDFAPLPASADSSCVGVDGSARSAGGQRTGADGPVNGLSPGPQRNTNGESDCLDEMANTSQDLPLRMKLEQVKTFRILSGLGFMFPSFNPQTLQIVLSSHCVSLPLQGRVGSEAAQAPPKRAFLKRGEGLSRFTNNRKPKTAVKNDPRPQPQARVLPRSNSEPTALQRGVSNGVQRFPVQRKTATLNKENRLKGVKGLSYQALRNAGHNMLPNPVTKQVGTMRGTERAESDADREKSCGSRVESAGGEVPRDSFELSFQEKLQRWDCDLQVENMELGEFELLEQAAEELSFSSNSSFVLKLQAARSLPPRRLSSTPIKSPPKVSPRRCTSVGSSAGVVVRSGTVNPEVFMMKIRDNTLMNRVSVEEKTELDAGREDNHEISDVSSCGGSEFEYQEVAGKPPAFPSTLSFPAQSNLPYDKHSYQDEESCRDSASDVTQVDDAESDSFLSNADESTLLEDKDGQQGRVVFDDNDTWNDLEHTAVCSANDGRLSPVTKATVNTVSPPERTLQRKVAVSEVVEVDKGAVIRSANQEPPPASQLMTRLFPSLKPKTQNAPLPPPPPSAVQSRQLRERLVELEIEIERFKKENSALTKLRQENEKDQENLRKERLEFEKTKVEELAKFEEHKREENRKLQKERKLFEKHALAARAIPDKKEREEIQVLRQQLISLQEELRGRESRWASTHGRLRQQIDSLNKDNDSLRDEVRMLEKLRFTALKKSPVNAEKDKGCNDGPKMFDSNVSSVPKGVKFAVSMFKTTLCCLCIWLGCEEVIMPSLSLLIKFLFCSSQIEKVLASGDRLISFPNGTKKEVSADGLTVKVTFFNGDTKQVTADQRVIYYYAETQTTHVTYPDGIEVLHFPNNQTEKHFPDGRKEITFPDQTIKNLFPNGREESVLTDGTIIQVNPDGTKEIHFNTGQREIHTADYKRREYPDGTVKTVYTDGRQETSYPTGRLRIKDKDGNVIVDNRV